MVNIRPNTRTRKLALLGSETLLGREIDEVLRNRQSSAVITAYAATGEGTFGEEEGEAVFVEPLRTESVLHDQAIIVAGTAEGARKVYDLAKSNGGRPVVIDCTGHLENQAEARIVAPLLEEPDIRSTGWLMVIAHPAANALGLMLMRLARYKPIRKMIAHIFEPASEQGKRGVSELHQQTTNLLSFKPLDKSVYDAQVSFNLLAQYGEDAGSKLSSIEQRIEHHVATILSRVAGPTIPMPSLRVVQAPVFHSYSMSVWAEFESDITPTGVAEALASAQIEVRGPNEEAPDTVAAANQSGLIVGDIRLDRNNNRAAWFWVVGDNLRLIADSVADLLSGFETERH